ncbi:UNVERIFIED_CONTAM: Eukaryotic translation initiation factor isoform 4E-2 [Sesamum calycinum]|uniref:Eukaryotic translation initiation factor isoform 4E n=1 Tax=Sesamum calycinum TaxID=2727403 RepID=A0AAW2QLT6_9LAMI
MASEVAAAASEVPAGAPATAEKQPHKLERKWTFWFDNQSKPKQGAAWGTSLRKCQIRWIDITGMNLLDVTAVRRIADYRPAWDKRACSLGVVRYSILWGSEIIIPESFEKNDYGHTCCFSNCARAATLAPRAFNYTEHSCVQCTTSSSLVAAVSLYDQIFRPSKFPANADFHLFRAGVEPKWEDPECTSGGKWTVTSSKKANLDTMWLETLMALIGEQFDEADEICGVVASVRQRQDKLSLWTKTAANEAAQMGIGRKWKEIIDVTDKISYSFHDDSRRERSAKSRYNV